MSTRVYEFRPDGAFSCWVSVHISDTHKQMNADAARFFRRHGRPIENDSATAGMSTPALVRKFTGEKGWWYYDRFATCFLNHQDLRKNAHEIIPHEALHAAMTHERGVLHFDMRYSPDGSSIEDDERLAYKVGQIAAGLYRTVAKDRKERAAKRDRQKRRP